MFLSQGRGECCATRYGVASPPQLPPCRRNPARLSLPAACREVVGFRAPNFRINNLMGQVLADLEFK